MMKRKCLAILLSLAMVLSAYTPAMAFAEVNDVATKDEKVVFIDMPKDWSTEALQAAVDNGLITGYKAENGLEIKAAGTLSRAELATIINRAFGATEKATLTGVSDVKAGNWYEAELQKAVKMGTLKINSMMRPNDKITRQEAFMVLSRAFGLKCTDNKKAINAFTDNTDIAAWAAESVCAMTENGYVGGSNGKVHPNANMSRAEFAVVMSNMVKQYINKTGTYKEVVAKGNVMINVAGVVLEGVTVNGDLYLGDGLGKGDVTLTNVTVTGKTIVRGGGANSITIDGGKYTGGITIQATASGGTRVVSKNAEGIEVTIAESTISGDKVILTGTFENVTVAAPNAQLEIPKDTVVGTITVSETAESAKVTVSGRVTTLNVEAPKAAATAAEGSKITNVKLTQTATGATTEAQKGAMITNVETKAEGAAVTGAGKVENIKVEGNNTSIDTIGSKVSVDKDAKGTTAGEKPMVGGSTGTTTGSGEATLPPSGGSGSGGGSSYSTYTVDTAEELTEALTKAGSGDTVKITANIGSAEAYGSYTVSKGVKIIGENVEADKAKVYGAFIVKADGVIFDNLAVYNQGQGAGIPVEQKNAINGYIANITITNCDFVSSNLYANGVMIFPSKESVTYTIKDNTFSGYTHSDGTWSTSGLAIAGGYKMSNKPFFQVDGAAAIPSNVNDAAIIENNSFANCSMDYNRCTWTQDNTIYTSYALAITDGKAKDLNLEYAAATGATVYMKGEVSIDEAATIAANTTLTIEKGATLTVKEGVTLTNHGILDVKGMLVNNGTIDGGGEMLVRDEATMLTGMKSNIAVVKLAADIMLSDMDGYYKLGTFTGTLDGANHTLTSQNKGWKALIDKTIGECEFKNLTMEYGSFIFPLVNNNVGNLKFTSVTLQGIIGGAVVNTDNNDSGFVCTSNGFTSSASIVFDKCVNNANFKVGGGGYAAVFVGGMAPNLNLDFKNCINNGNLQGSDVALFIGNPSRGGKNGGTVKIENCINNGILTGTKSAALFSTLNKNVAFDELNTKFANVVIGPGSIGLAADHKTTLTVGTDGCYTIGRTEDAQEATRFDFRLSAYASDKAKATWAISIEKSMDKAGSTGLKPGKFITQNEFQAKFPTVTISELSGIITTGGIMVGTYYDVNEGGYYYVFKDIAEGNTTYIFGSEGITATPGVSVFKDSTIIDSITGI